MKQPFVLRLAGEEDASVVAGLCNAAARDLTARFGTGRWSGETTLRGVAAALRRSRIAIALEDDHPIATFRLSTRKPWAIDRAYFTAVSRPIYLTDMAVDPYQQRRGIGRWCLGEAVRIAREVGADAICLDAYDADAGAGPFYARCGFRDRGRASYRGSPLVYYEMLLGRPVR